MKIRSNETFRIGGYNLCVSPLQTNKYQRFMQQSRLLFVSSYCQYCNDVLLFLKKAGAESQYQIVNIDNLRGQIPPYITCVPTLIIDGRTKLSDEQLFKYIETQLGGQGQLEEYGFYESQYSFLDGSYSNRPSQSFAEIQSPLITTAPIMTETHTSKGKTNNKAYEMFLQQRNAEFSDFKKPTEAELKRMYDQVFPPAIE